MPEQAPRSNLTPSLPQAGRAGTVDMAIDEAWRVLEAMGADGAAVYTVEADGALVCLASSGGLTSLSPYFPPLDDVADTTPAWTRMARNDHVHWLSLSGARGVVGWLALSLRASDAFPKREALQVAIDQLASALATQRMEEALRRTQRQAEMLYNMMRLAHPPAVSATTLPSLVRGLVTDGGFLAAVIYRFEASRLICEAWNTASGEDGAQTDLERLESVARRAVLTRSTQCERASTAPGDGLEVNAPGLLMAAPLLRDELAMGALAVEGAGRAWRGEDAHFVAMLAEPVSIAMENTGPRAHLYNQLQEKAAHAEAELETVVREAPAGLVVLDDEWRILRLNPAACRLLDCEVEVALGQPFVDVVKDVRLMENLAALAVAEVEAHRPMIEARLDETRCDVLMGIARLGPGYLVSLSDITALKDVDRLKSEIISNVSHEFRAPLASIKAYTELLSEPSLGSDAETRQRFLGIIGEEADYLTDLITNMLDLSRLQSGHLQLVYTWLDLRHLIGDVINMLLVQAQARQITFKVDGPPAGPLLWADRQLMIIILKNLMGNAVKYNRIGGHVTITIEDSADEVTVRVRDDGVGIPANAIPQLFEKFYRVVSTTESGIQGTGLGLALTKAAVDAHQGSVSVDSWEGKGTEFTVRLPNRAADAPDSGGRTSR